MQNENTYFEQINSALTVKSICTKFRLGIPVDMLDYNSKDIWEEFVGYKTDEPYPIINDKNQPVGFVWFNEIDENLSLVETMERLQPSDFLSSNTTALDAINLFVDQNSTHFYILEKNNIKGVLLFDDFYKPLGRLAFLALALEIEELALLLCQLSSLREDCWTAISTTRQQTARRLYTKRHGKRLGRTKLENLPLKELIDCAYLTDKATMIWKCKLVPAKTRK